VTLNYAAEIKDHVSDLLGKVGPLHTVSGLGFADADRELVERSVGELANTTTWSFIDLRALDGDAARDRVKTAIGGTLKSKVLAVRAGSVQRPVHMLVRAVVDKKEEIDLGDHRGVPRPKDTSIVVLVDGASKYAELDPELQRIPYWDFIT
jgi:hypothetical protein